MTNQLEFRDVQVAITGADEVARWHPAGFRYWLTTRALMVEYQWTGEVPREGPVYWGTVFKGSSNRVGKTLGFKLVDGELSGFFVSDMSNGRQGDPALCAYTLDGKAGTLRVQVSPEILDGLGDDITWLSTMTIWQHDQDSRSGTLELD